MPIIMRRRQPWALVSMRASPPKFLPTHLACCIERVCAVEPCVVRGICSSASWSLHSCNNSAYLVTDGSKCFRCGIRHSLGDTGLAEPQGPGPLGQSSRCTRHGLGWDEITCRCSAQALGVGAAQLARIHTYVHMYVHSTNSSHTGIPVSSVSEKSRARLGKMVLLLLSGAEKWGRPRASLASIQSHSIARPMPSRYTRTCSHTHTTTQHPPYHGFPSISRQCASYRYRCEDRCGYRCGAVV